MKELYEPNLFIICVPIRRTKQNHQRFDNQQIVILLMGLLYVFFGDLLATC